ncbi:MAG: methylmalonyl Co-A mutase-associated GTPase MeaB [Vulcanimicrobiaceae bacterium]
MDEPDATISALFDAHRPRGLARAISRAEAGEGAALMRHVAERTGRARTLGLTGPPGVGKSTLCAQLVARARREGLGVGVVSVDPSSPFTRGAVLGDRIRLAEHFTDPEVFIRSMASRGHLGGLAGASADAVALMDAFGKELVIVETVGVGQSEVEIAELVDTTLVVLQPGSGDAVQLLKAGILEIADVFVVNKADHPLAHALERDIRAMLAMREQAPWTPPLVATRAMEGAGTDELWEAIAAHGRYLAASGEGERRRRTAFAFRVEALVRGALERRIAGEVAALASERDGVAKDPYSAARVVLARLEAGSGRR